MADRIMACKRLGLDAFTIGVLVLGATYTALGWTPSSYGAVLSQLAQPRAGLVFGEPREIREDEWARWTPLVQAAVRNDFERTNHTSLYREDLRNVEGLPLRDWGLLFKPYYWPFFLVSPAAAFSFAHAFWICAFLVGYHHLFRALRIARPIAAAASVTLFFTGFVQTWWTTYGPLLAGYPWLLLAALAPLGPRIKALAVTGSTVAWLLVLLYPPLQITLMFAGALLLLGLRRDFWRARDLVPSLVGLFLGVALALLYYRDAFLAMRQTLYPGQRVMSGGGEPLIQWLAQVLPFLVTSGFDALVSENVCEASTVGTYLPLLLLCFADHRALAVSLSSPRTLRRGWAALVSIGLGIVLGSLWLHAPIPAALGKALLWHFVPPERMWFACGFLILVAALHVLQATPLRVSWPRGITFAVAVVASWIGSEWILGAHRASRSLADLGVLAPVALLLAFRTRFERRLPAALVACAGIANALGFGGFNPIQAARPIFEAAELPATRPLARLASRHPRHWLVLEGGYGTWLNGLGFASATHVLLAPQLDFFRGLLPRLPSDELEQLFNRTLYVVLTPRTSPELVSESVVAVPVDAYDPPTVAVALGDAPGPHEPGGVVAHRSAWSENGRTVVFLEGWLLADASDPQTRLWVSTSLPVARALAYPSLRRDGALKLHDPELLVSGFALRLELGEGALVGGPGAPHRSLLGQRVCVVSEDPLRGWHALREPGAPSCEPAPPASGPPRLDPTPP